MLEAKLPRKTEYQKHATVSRSMWTFSKRMFYTMEVYFLKKKDCEKYDEQYAISNSTINRIMMYLRNVHTTTWQAEISFCERDQACTIKGPTYSSTSVFLIKDMNMITFLIGLKLTSEKYFVIFLILFFFRCRNCECYLLK